MIGSKLGDYEILRLVGKGGMGAVYEALKPSINRRVAIKLLLPEYAEREDVVRRFLNEARAVNAINHPGVVQISDIGKSTAGSIYLVMEFLEGETLSERLQQNRGKLGQQEGVIIAWQLAGVLAAAHAKSIVHRGSFGRNSPAGSSAFALVLEKVRNHRPARVASQPVRPARSERPARKTAPSVPPCARGNIPFRGRGRLCHHETIRDSIYRRRPSRRPRHAAGGCPRESRALRKPQNRSWNKSQDAL